MRVNYLCCAQITMAPGQCGVILDTSRPELISQGRPKSPTSTSTGSVPCVPEALASKTWYKTLEMSLHKAIWAEQGWVGPALHHAQMNILVLVLGWTSVFMQHSTSAKKLGQTRALPASRGCVIHNPGNPSMLSWQLVLINLVAYVDMQCFNLNVTKRFNITDTQCFKYAQLQYFWN